ncbi:MAG: hypothetical protein H0X62_11915 [Bacteroidetes bacterium]|nr:hypothetical protein [Bacteroidota bacterium]
MEKTSKSSEDFYKVITSALEKSGKSNLNGKIKKKAKKLAKAAQKLTLKGIKKSKLKKPVKTLASAPVQKEITNPVNKLPGSKVAVNSTVELKKSRPLSKNEEKVKG